MKTAILFLSLFTSATLLAQEKFAYGMWNGLTPKYSVVEIDSISKSDLYKKAINWIKETYKNPDEVIKTTIDNDKIRFEGYQSQLICMKTMGMNNCYNALYTIEVSFKENKYKFTPVSLSYRVPPSQYAAAATVDVPFDDGSIWYKKETIRKMYATIPEAISNHFNRLNEDLKNYILSSTTQSSDEDDW